MNSATKLLCTSLVLAISISGTCTTQAMQSNSFASGRTWLTPSSVVATLATLGVGGYMYRSWAAAKKTLDAIHEYIDQTACGGDQKKFRFSEWRVQDLYKGGEAWPTACDLDQNIQAVTKALAEDVAVDGRIPSIVNEGFLDNISKVLQQERIELNTYLNSLRPFTDAPQKLVQILSTDEWFEIRKDYQGHSFTLSRHGNADQLALVLKNTQQTEQSPYLNELEQLLYVQTFEKYKSELQLAGWQQSLGAFVNKVYGVWTPHYKRATELYWQLLKRYARLMVLKNAMDEIVIKYKKQQVAVPAAQDQADQ